MLAHDYLVICTEDLSPILFFKMYYGNFIAVLFIIKILCKSNQILTRYLSALYPPTLAKFILLSSNQFQT